MACTRTPGLHNDGCACSADVPAKCLHEDVAETTRLKDPHPAGICLGCHQDVAQHEDGAWAAVSE